MVASPIVDSRLLSIIADDTLYGFEANCRYATPCPMAPNVDHVTVLCLDKDHFGEYYDYVSTSEVSEQRRASFFSLQCLTDQCPMSLSSYQTNPDDIDTMLERAIELRDPPAKFGGWIFMGAVPSMYRDGNFLRHLLSPTPVPGARRQPRAALVEGLFFVSVRLKCLAT